MLFHLLKRLHRQRLSLQYVLIFASTRITCIWKAKRDTCHWKPQGQTFSTRLETGRLFFHLQSILKSTQHSTTFFFKLVALGSILCPLQLPIVICRAYILPCNVLVCKLIARPHSHLNSEPGWHLKPLFCSLFVQMGPPAGLCPLCWEDSTTYIITRLLWHCRQP